jgi:DNA primase
MERDHLSFPEALDELARRAGVEIRREAGAKGSVPGENERLVRAHDVAVRLYCETLESREGEAARAEIARRRFPPEIVRAYRLGAVPTAWEWLVSRARREGIGADVLERAGLAVRRDDGTHYDRFRDRLMFPIEIMGPRVIAFGGRVLGEGEPKYLNSPETPLFRKRKTLYGLPHASAAMRASREAILVEGYMDVLALASAGFANVVGALGTAFGPEHAQLLARAVDRVVVAFDGDAAGVKAMLASVGPLVSAGLDVRVVLLPAGEDPDSFVRAQGADAFRTAIDKSRGIVDALLGDEAYETPAGRDRALRRALGALAGLDDPIRRRVHLQEIAERTRVPVDLLDERLTALRDRERAPAHRDAPSPAARVERAKTRSSWNDAPDRTYLGILLHHEKQATGLLARVPPEEIVDPVVRRIVTRIQEHAGHGSLPTAAALLEELRDDEEAVSVVGEIAVAKDFDVEPERAAEVCVRRLAMRTLNAHAASLDREMRKAKAQGEEARSIELVQRRLEIMKRIEALRTESEPKTQGER